MEHPFTAHIESPSQGGDWLREGEVMSVLSILSSQYNIYTPHCDDRTTAARTTSTRATRRRRTSCSAPRAPAPARTPSTSLSPRRSFVSPPKFSTKCSLRSISMSLSSDSCPKPKSTFSELSSDCSWKPFPKTLGSKSPRNCGRRFGSTLRMVTSSTSPTFPSPRTTPTTKLESELFQRM